MLDTPVPPDALQVLLIRLACRMSFAGVMWREAGIGTGGVVGCRAALPGCAGGRIGCAGHRGGRAVRGVTAERARLDPPLSRGRPGRADGPLEASGVVPAPGECGG